MTKRMPRKLVLTIYRRAMVLNPWRNRRRLSFAKEEKVVKPPKKPVIRKSRRFVERAVVSTLRVKIKPIKREPTRLTTHVPHGKTPPIRSPIKSVTKYRAIAPKAPPVATAIKNCNFSTHIAPSFHRKTPDKNLPPIISYFPLFVK